MSIYDQLTGAAQNYQDFRKRGGFTPQLYGILENIGDAASQFLSPRGRQAAMNMVEVGDMLNPVGDTLDAMQMSGEGDYVGAMVNVAGLAIPAGIVRLYGPQTALAAAKAIQETLTGTGDSMAQVGSDVYEKFIERMNQPGPGPEVVGSNLGNILYKGQEPLPQSMDNLSAALDKEPALANMLPFVTPEEAAIITPRNVQNVEASYRAFNPNELVAAAVAGNPKLGWYYETSKALDTIFGEDTRRFATLLAAMSPQTSVEMNLKNAVRTFANWEKAGRPKDKNEILDIMGRSVLGSKGKDSVLDAWKNNSVSALSAPEGTPGEAFRLSGPKVDNFGFAVSGDLDRFTNDAWQANLTGVPQDMFSRSSGPLPGYSPGYIGASAAGRQAADLMSGILGEKIMPSEVQETGWSFGKALYEQMKEGMADTSTLNTKGMSAREIVEAGALNEGRISDVPDFATLLQVDEYGAPLREIGYGSSIDEAARRTGQLGARDLSAARDRSGELAVAGRLDTLYNHRQRVSAAEPFRFGAIGAKFSDQSGNRLFAPYRKPSGQSVPLSFGAEGREIAPTEGYTEFLSKVAGSSSPVMYQLKADSPSRAAFVEKMREAQATHGVIGKSVDVYDAKDYKGYKLFATQNGEAGFAIAPDGELSSAVSARGSGITGFSDAVLAAGVQNGARWLQAFDTVLPEKYSQFGFKPVARIKFSKEFFVEEHGEEALEEFMKINKNFNGGMPDLVFMAYDPKFKNTVANNVGGQFTDDYDKAVNAAKKAAKVK